MGTQVRKFNFFDVKKSADGTKLQDAVKDARITSSSAGYGHIIIGDSKGWAHLLTRQLDLVSFEAHSSAISLVNICSTSNLAVTVSNLSNTRPSEVKIWLPDRQNNQGLPVCAQVLAPDPRSFSENKRSQSTCPAVTTIGLHPNNSLMAIGFDDGSVMLYRGDVRRPHGTKHRVIVTLSSGSVTNLQFRLWEKSTHLFVTTTTRVYCINCAAKDKETTHELDTFGCNPGCSALTDSKHEHEFLIAKNDAIYSYTTDSRASCYAFSGKKLSLAAYKGYMIVVSEDSNYQGNLPIKVTVYDPLNKLISLSTEFSDVAGVVCEWGSLYVVTHEPSLVHLCEKDLRTKFDILFRKNQFDIAVNMAKMQCCNAEDISEILKQYGDWLYSKGNFSAAIDQYIKTTPHLEPSYVIIKYLEPQHIAHLTTYLQSLHSKGFCNSTHKTLLLNCYTRLRDTQQLDEFIMNKEGQLDIDVELGIKVCRSATYYDHALTLASQSRKHGTYIAILINDKKDFAAAIRYINTLGFEEARESILLYGSILLNHCPDEMTELLVNICTNYIPSGQQKSSAEGQKANPEDFEYLLVGQQVGVSFLERLKEGHRLSSHLNTTLLAKLLHQYSHASPDDEQNISEKIIRMLKNSENAVDRDHALLLCDKHRFYAGRMILWEQAGMFEEIISWFAGRNDFESMLDTCTKQGDQHPQLWCLALRKITSEKIVQEPNSKYLNIILKKIEENQLLQPMEVADILSSSPFVTLGQVKDYLLRVVATHTASVRSQATTVHRYKEETSKMKREIDVLTSEARQFTGTKCSVCNNNLDLPSIHFLCRHSFHMHCFESYTGADSDCPLCLPEYKRLTETADSQARNVSQHDTLQQQMGKCNDYFSVMADFISKGALSTNQDLSFLHPQPTFVKAKISHVDAISDQLKQDCMVARESEGRVRLSEKNTQIIIEPVPEKEVKSQVLEKTYTAHTGVSEGRLRLREASSKWQDAQAEATGWSGTRLSTDVEAPSEGRIRASQPSAIINPESRLRTNEWKPGALHEHISPGSCLPNSAAVHIPNDISSSVSNKRSSTKEKRENPFQHETQDPQDDSSNPFGDYETEECSNNPFEENYDATKNPFEEEIEKLHNPIKDYDDALNPFGED